MAIGGNGLSSEESCGKSTLIGTIGGITKFSADGFHAVPIDDALGASEVEVSGARRHGREARLDALGGRRRLSTMAGTESEKLRRCGEHHLLYMEQWRHQVCGGFVKPTDEKIARRSKVSPEELRRERELHDFSRLHPTLTVEQIRQWCASGELAASFPTLPELFSSMSDAELREWCEGGEYHRGPIPSLELPPNPGLLLRQVRALVDGDPEFMARYPDVYKLLFSPRTRRAGGRSRSSTCPRSGCTSPSALPRPGCLRERGAGRRTRTPWRP
jgi:hypothetical protein